MRSQIKACHCQANHKPLLEGGGLTIGEYAYFDQATHTVDIEVRSACQAEDSLWTPSEAEECSGGLTVGEYAYFGLELLRITAEQLFSNRELYRSVQLSSTRPRTRSTSRSD